MLIVNVWKQPATTCQANMTNDTKSAEVGTSHTGARINDPENRIWKHYSTKRAIPYEALYAPFLAAQSQGRRDGKHHPIPSNYSRRDLFPPRDHGAHSKQQRRCSGSRTCTYIAQARTSSTVSQTKWSWVQLATCTVGKWNLLLQTSTKTLFRQLDS